MTAHDVRAAELMLQHCDKIARTVERVVTFEGFISDDDAPDAVAARCVQLGELSRRGLSVEFKQSQASISWNEIYSLGRRVEHEYAQLDFLDVWKAILEDIPVLARTLRAALEEYHAGGSLCEVELK